MAKTREKSGAEGEQDEGMASMLLSGVRNFEVKPWLDRAEKMVQARPALTLGIAAGAGFILGVSVLSRFGRVLLLSTLGIAADLLVASTRGVGGIDGELAKATS